MALAAAAAEPVRAPSPGPAIEARGLARSFPGVKAVRGLDLRVARGEVYGFLGLNGAGKTTTLKMLTTILKPTSGEARVAGHDVVHQALDVRRSVGVLNELEAVTQPYWTPHEYLGHFARLRGIAHDDAPRRIDAILRKMGIWEVGHVPVGTFSSGMKRKVELARALLHDPEVLFLDEPTRELDLPSKRGIWDLLTQHVKEQGASVFLCSHDVLEVEALCDRVGVLHGGRLLHEAPIATLRASNTVRVLPARDPERARAAAQASGLVREAWVEGASVLAAMAPGAKPSALLQALVLAGVEVDAFHGASGLEARLSALMRGEASTEATA